MLQSLHKSGFKFNRVLLIVSAAILNSLALRYINFPLAFLGISLGLYVLIQSESARQAFYAGAFFGGVTSLSLQFWIIPVVADYARGNILLGSLCYLASSLVLALSFGLQFYSYTLIRLPGIKIVAHIFNALLVAGIWVLFEWIRGELFSAMPWLSYTVGITQGKLLFLLQPAAYGGVFILSFISVFAAYFVAFALYIKNWKHLLIPITVLLIQLIIGYFLYTSIKQETERGTSAKFSAALIIPALSPETVWNNESADVLTRHLFALNHKAVEKKAQLIVWTETVVPWTYAPDDDFLNELITTNSTSNAYTLIGMNTAFSSSANTQCNSAYFLDSAGKKSGRYDKQDLLTLVEKPLWSQGGSLILPFLSTYDLKMKPGSFKRPIATPWGNAGVLICNESTNFSLSKDLVNNGASFLVNMGNTNWFSDRFIARQHFYNCRLRAIENRKDMLINHNMGICGVVNASGEIILQADGTKSSVQTAEIVPNNLSHHNPIAFISFIAFIILIAVLNILFPNYLINKF